MDAKHRNRILVLGKYKNEGGPKLGVAELIRNLVRNPKPKLRKVAHGQRYYKSSTVSITIAGA